jgi:hypothetical protein
MKKLLSLLFLAAITLTQPFINSTIAQEKPIAEKPEDVVTQKVFATIFASYYLGLTENIKPKSAFEMPTALLGYTASYSNKLKATLIYDVTRTTNNIQVTDQNGNPLNVNFFEGSRYTAYLKMAEIMYSANKYLDFRIGQLLNTQYLTVQDKFWGYRYIYFTYQEVHRYGNPADFGAQADIKLGGKILNQISLTNGEGPFRHQDTEGKFLISNNLEIRPIDGLVLKLYADYCPTSESVAEAKPKSAISAFAGYKTSKFRFGLEYNKVNNLGFRKNSEYYGISSFGSYSFNEKFDVLARYDYINKSSTLSIDKGHFILSGVQYKPHKNLSCSINLRALNPGEKYWVYTSFGVSF